MGHIDCVFCKYQPRVVPDHRLSGSSVVSQNSHNLKEPFVYNCPN